MNSEHRQFHDKINIWNRWSSFLYHNINEISSTSELISSCPYSVNVKELIFALLGVWLGTTPFGVKLMGDLALSDWKFTLNSLVLEWIFSLKELNHPLISLQKVPNHTPKRAEISSFTLTEYNLSRLNKCIKISWKLCCIIIATNLHAYTNARLYSSKEEPHRNNKERLFFIDQ